MKMLENEDKRLLERVQQFISNLRIINEHSADEIIIMRMEASYLLERFHELRERIINET